MTGTAVAETKPKKPIEVFRNQLGMLAPELAMVLPAHISEERFRRVAMTAVQMTPGLLECTPQSVFAACLNCAKDGLLPDGKEAALVKFRNKDGDVCQYMPMVRGLIKLARQSGEVATLSAQVVYEKDEWHIDHASGERPRHLPYHDGPPGKVRLAYAIATFKDGTFQVEVMRRDEIEKVRNVSRAKNSGPWVDWFEEMARKTVLRRLMKYLSLSPEVQRAIEQDDKLYDLTSAEQERRAARPRTLSDDFAEPHRLIDAEHRIADAAGDAQDGDYAAPGDDAPEGEEAAPEPPQADAGPVWSQEDQEAALAEIAGATTQGALNACRPYMDRAREAKRLNAAVEIEQAILRRERDLKRMGPEHG